MPAPANGHTDNTTKAIGLALDAIEVGHPGGLVLPVAVLRDRVARFLQHKRMCRFPEVAAELPGLVRNVHTTLATGADHGELLELAVYLHANVTRQWLRLAAAPDDLVRRVVFLARRLARERDAVTTLGVAGFGVADTLLAGGAFELARAVLDSLTLRRLLPPPPVWVGLVTTPHAWVAALNGCPGEAAAESTGLASKAGCSKPWSPVIGTPMARAERMRDNFDAIPRLMAAAGLQEPAEIGRPHTRLGPVGLFRAAAG